MTVPVTFACGHRSNVDPSKVPTCHQCGETRIGRCVAPAPRFVGHVRGPSATYRPDLEPVVVDLTEKDSTHG